jgi:predicted DNA-binding transcriptional regulator AlpA
MQSHQSPTSPPTALAAPVTGADEMMTIGATCAFFGGDRPLNPATLYRGIKAGRYPPPVHPSPRLSRWLRTECIAARQRLIAARDQPEAA